VPRTPAADTGPGQVAYAIKAELTDPDARSWVFEAQKTMYGGKQIAVGDCLYVFASENEGGTGLVARGIVISVQHVVRRPAGARQTPRVSIVVRRTASGRQPLGRRELKPFGDWQDGQPQTELNFKFYRQATNKLVGLSAGAAAFLDSLF
jgi:hypothetical protein